MAFETFDLGRIIATAEGIKGMRRDAENDKLRQAYLGQQISSGQQQQSLQKQEFDQQTQAREARNHYLAAQAVEQSPDPIAAAKQLAPEMIAAFEQQHGPGTFERLPPAVVQQIAAMGKQKSAAAAGINLQPSPDLMAQQQFAREMDQTNFGQQKQLAGMQFGQQRGLAGLQHQYGLEEIAARGTEERKTAEMTAPARQMKSIQQLRKEFRSLPTVKDYETVLPLIESAKKAPDNGYGDLQLIYTAGKILDPGSVVREGELALTLASGSPLQRILGTTRFSLEKGGRLPPKLRQQLVGMLQERVSATQSAYTRDYDQYSQYAQEGGVDPTSVVGSRPESAFGQSPNGTPVQIKGDADYARLPSGTQYIAPDGSMRTKR